MTKAADFETKTDTNTATPDGVSRRAWLGGAALAIGAGAAGMVVTRASAQTKMNQKAAQYQDQPKDGKKCGGCQNFQAPNACKVVDGSISENGWCQLYAPKSA